MAGEPSWPGGLVIVYCLKARELGAVQFRTVEYEVRA